MPLTRRDFFHSAGIALIAAGAAQRTRAAAPYDAFEKSIGELQADLAAGKATAVELVRFYLARIAAYDQAGPRLNAVLFVNPNAIRDARALDDERKKKGARGPLHGIPVLLKDNFETSDMPTTGGSLALSGVVPREDAFQVRKLRQAGAVILGKVNLHELALGLTTVSSLGGQTLDPYDPARAPGGSSGGSGVAVAANFAAFAMGTDTSGSIRIPSSHNAIVGLRPSLGLSSRSGIIPFGHTQDTGGPMARTVADIALILDATVGVDPADPVTATGREAIPRTYTSSLKPGALEGARVGVLAEFFGSGAEDQEVGSIVLRAVDDMKKHGATAIDVAVPDLTALLAESNLLSQELKFYLGDYLRRSPGAYVKSIEELLASGLHTAQFSGFLEAANAQPDDYLASDDYRKRLAARERLAGALLGVMDDRRLDAIVYPTARRIAPMVGGNQLGSNAGLSAQTGFPAITVPAGVTPGGFPVGVEMIGRRFAEPTLIALAYSYEQATRHRRPPPGTPPLGRSAGGGERVAASAAPGAASVTISVVATGAQAVPRSDVTFEVGARLVFDERTSRLGYTLTVAGESRDRVSGVYLHRKANRPNGGVAQILAKSPRFPMTGAVTLLAADVADLKAGKCYISAISTSSPLRAAKADIVWP
jgi:Asp-tRNA(Asn)/Glu-tRNA(Gln) amidotransferase A subunit family amidase